VWPGISKSLKDDFMEKNDIIPGSSFMRFPGSIDELEAIDTRKIMRPVY
jgi:hypothetical protein